MRHFQDPDLKQFLERYGWFPYTQPETVNVNNMFPKLLECMNDWILIAVPVESLMIPKP